MVLSFFEEFPTKSSLDRINLIPWPTKLYLAAQNIPKFNSIRSGIKNKNVKECIYWPILSRTEGYWISPFSEQRALARIFGELDGKKIPIMLDLELPTRQNPWLYCTQRIHFWDNKRLIADFIRNYAGEVYLAEYYPEGKWKEKVLGCLGLHYVSPKVKVIKMMYHSLHHFNESFVREELKRGKQEFGNNFMVALGTIAPGIHGNEPVLSAAQLEQDLRLCKESGIKEVIIFRLGGLNKNYLKVLQSYAL